MRRLLSGSLVLPRAALAVVLVAGCSERELASDAGTGSTTSTTAGSSTSTEPTTGCGGECPDLPALDCDLLAQDCPAGSKCSSNGDVTFCAPLDPSPVGPGEPCTVMAKGVDTCAIGSFCWVDERCHALCSPDADPACPPGQVCVNGDGLAQICVTSCNPLMQDCPEGQECVIPSSNLPVCAPDFSGAGGEPGDVCEFSNGCDPGNQCDQHDTVPACAGSSCCAAFCDTAMPACPDGQSCLLFYPAGTAPAGLETLGTCGV
jgi:hypothetical protein